jgi:hypothetical protein
MYEKASHILKVALETLAVVKLNIFFHDVNITSATGFIYRFADSYYLVTNLHCLNGIDPITGKFLDSRHFVPNKLEFYLNVFSYAKLGSFDVVPFKIDLLKNGQPVWFESVAVDSVIDIAVIELSCVLAEFENIKNRIGYLRGGRMLVSINEKGDAEYVYHAYPRIGSDVFILGYPKGIGQGSFPIWKKGSIATEPLFGAVPDGSPVILIDALTRDGMSGSPVLYFGSKVAGDYGAATAESDGPYVVGVYAGREGVTPEESSMALGRVWKVEFLDRLFSNKYRTQGKYFGPIS